MQMNSLINNNNNGNLAVTIICLCQTFGSGNFWSSVCSVSREKRVDKVVDCVCAAISAYTASILFDDGALRWWLASLPDSLQVSIFRLPSFRSFFILPVSPLTRMPFGFLYFWSVQLFKVHGQCCELLLHTVHFHLWNSIFRCGVGLILALGKFM